MGSPAYDCVVRKNLFSNFVETLMAVSRYEGRGTVRSDLSNYATLAIFEGLF